MNTIKSDTVGAFRHDLVDLGFGYQVRIYNGDQLYHTGFNKRSEEQGLDSLESAVAFTEKQIRKTRDQV